MANHFLAGGQGGRAKEEVSRTHDEIKEEESSSPIRVFLLRSLECYVG